MCSVLCILNLASLTWVPYNMYCCPSQDEMNLLRFQFKSFLKLIYQYFVKNQEGVCLKSSQSLTKCPAPHQRDGQCEWVEMRDAHT